MLLVKVTNELLAVKHIRIYKQYGKQMSEFYRQFINNSKGKNADKIADRRMLTFKKLALILDVPVSFIVSIINLERIKENENNWNWFAGHIR